MKKAARATLLLLGLAATLVGCVDDLDSVLRSGSDRPGPRCSASDDGRTWQLGTGHAEDIKRLAPGFFTGRNGAWRRAALAPSPDGVTEVRPANIEGAEAFEIITQDVAYRIRAIRVDDAVAILATPGQCPKVSAVDHCVDDRLKTELLVNGSAPCLGPITVPSDRVAIAMGNNDDRKLELVFGKPLLEKTSSNSVSFAIYLKGSQEPAGHVERRVGDFSKAVPDEVLAFLGLGLELPAGMLWRNVPDEMRTPAASARIAKARVAGIVSAASSLTTPLEVGELLRTHPFGVLPGDTEVKDLIAEKIRSLVAERVRAEPRPRALFEIALCLRLMEPLTADKPDVSGLEAKYGPLLQLPAYADPKVAGSFMLLLPNSKYTRALEAEDANANDQAAVDAKKQAGRAETEDSWTEVQGRGDELATLAYKIRFGRQNFTQTRHNQRGLAQMEKYREGLVRDAFCPAKRAFVQRAGAAEYSRRASEHCSSEAPTDVGVGGVEKKLTAECRAAFATGC
jgi:hypothetical protein